ncbi:hypothetical protein [Streptomyces sp. NPDC093991]|uniref:hypothetical protein n=1 Tax=unclassified Streptomyces TaxID=2593676 RepID=UPI0034291FD6
MPTTSTNTQTHPLAPRRRRATGFLLVLVILWVIAPEVVEALAMWISIIGSVLSFPVFGADKALVRRFEDIEKRVMSFREKLTTRMREIGMILAVRTAWWNGGPVFHWRII